LNAAADLSALQKVVQETVEQGRLGVPRFLRCMARVDDSRRLQGSLDELTSLAEAWFRSPPVQRHKLGQDGAVYQTEILKWSEGQGALLTVSLASSDDPPALDLMLIGSRGTLYHES
jgi:hypothetical protein